ncbi:phage major tail tube protein [Fodinicurvata sp. EGI_FJ10296]|uniref:phage major tail tube protein n=1 Tax=Fodinicurvata sp. EGI_FJ10296 TaxID=3231908 RepID=UPI0034565C81
MKHPRVIRNFNLFVDGQGFAGRVEEAELPSLTLNTDEFRGGGMDAPVDVELGMEKMEFTATFADWDPDLLGLLGTSNQPVTLRAAAQAQGGPVEPIRIQLRGLWRGLEPGGVKAGDRATLKVSATLAYYRFTQAGTDVIEIDLENMIRRIRGVDQLADQRAALGL